MFQALRTRNVLLAALSAVVLMSAPAAAQDWPTKPIRYVIPFPPGGTQDVIARIVTPKISEILGQPIIIENRPGAAGVVGADIVAKAKSDSHVVLMTSLAPIAFAPAIEKNLPYDPVKDFTHAASLGLVQQVLIVGAEVKAAKVADLVAMANGPAGPVAFGSSGNGSVSHLMLEKFRQAAKANLKHVPYRGAAPAMNDVIASVIPAAFDGLPSALPFAKAGQVKVLAVAGRTRSDALPNVPTLVELGYPEMVVYSWFGIALPADSPAAAAAKLNAAVARAMQDPTIKARYAELSIDASLMSQAEMTSFVTKEIATWKPLIAGLNP